MESQESSLLGLVLRALGLAGMLVVLLWVGEDSRLSIAAGGNLLEPAWALGRDPADVVVALVRAALLVLDGYLLVVVLLALIARLTGAVAAAAAFRWSVAPLLRAPWARSRLGRAALSGVFGMGMLVSSLGVPPIARAAVRGGGIGGTAVAVATQDVHDPGEIPLLRRLPRPTFDAPPRIAPLDGVVPPPLRRPLQLDPHPGAAGPPDPAPSAAPHPADRQGHDAAAEPAGSGTEAGDQPATRTGPPPQAGSMNWTVRPGDHLWAIAENTLRDRRNGAVPERTVRAYWRRLIDVNRDRLVDPDNPDLIVPGQVLILPVDPG